MNPTRYLKKNVRSVRRVRQQPTRRSSVAAFQVNLLKGLAVTPNTLSTWQEQVAAVLDDAADVLPVSFFFTVTDDDGARKAEIYWAGPPASAARAAAESVVAAGPAAPDASGPVPIAHRVSRRGAPAAAGRKREVVLRTRPFPAGSALAGGVAGLGLFSGRRLTPEQQLGSESALIALMNIIGTARALAAFVHDAERFSTRDPLTNLYNQISFWDLLEYEVVRSRRQQYKFSLLVIDLDNFKTINDTYGHETGDAFLKTFSAILKNAVRGGDIVARYAGDQFTAVLPVCDEGQAYTVAQRVIDNLRNHAFPLADGATLQRTASVGVAVCPDHATDAKDLFLLADSMLAKAKSFGKDRLSMPGEQDNLEDLKSIGEQSFMILDALSKKQIVPYFQPIMNVADKTIEAFEVLTRIVTPERVISAAEFIDTAEGMGAIGRLDYQLFEHALAKVRDARYTGNLFINLSPKALVLSEFLPTVRKMMRDYGLDPAKMIFEITERDTVKNVKLIDKFITAMKDDGFRFAIDDFGSGYSSFHYIKTFRVDFLKVDGEFIRQLAGGESVEKHIVASIAGLAGRLGIKTVAEYVESEQILSEVRSAGIMYAQGYYIRKPSPDLF